MQSKNSSSFAKFMTMALVTLAVLATNITESKAQFSQAVIVMKGTVRSSESGKPVAVKVSIRAANDTAMEVTASQSNSASGKYLVVLKPSHKYWVHLEGASILSKDTLIETPASAQTVSIGYDFAVDTREVEISSATPVATPSMTIETSVAQRRD